MQSSITSQSQCKHCGHLNKWLVGDGPTIVILDTDAPVLKMFMLRALDNLQCDACKEFLDVQPSFFYLSTNPPRALFCLGTLVQHSRDIYVKELDKMAKEIGIFAIPQELPKPTNLRDQVAIDLRQRLQIVLELLHARIKGSDNEFIFEKWRKLPANVFTLVKLTAEIPQLKLQLTRTDGSELLGYEILEILATAQVTVWGALWGEWSKGNTAQKIFENDLRNYIANEAILPTALEKASVFFDGLAKRSDLTPRAQYVLQTIRASVWHASGNPNPRVSEWAKCFFEFELAVAYDNNPDINMGYPLIISSERARETISYEAAWDAIIPFAAVGYIDEKFISILQRITAKVGHENLISDAMNGMKFTGSNPIKMDTVLQVIQRVVKETDLDIEDILASLDIIMCDLVSGRQVKDVEIVLDELFRLFGDAPETRASIYCWYGKLCKLMRCPDQFLARIGDKPSQWESDLSAMTRSRLWTERSNSLRLKGRLTEALQELLSALEVFPDDGDARNRRVAERNLAILLRETGSADTALEILKKLLHDTTGREHIDTLEALGLTYLEYGRYIQSLECFDMALEMAKGPWEELGTKLNALKALGLAATDRFSEALTILTELEPKDDIPTLLAVGSAWLNVIDNQHQVSTEAMNNFTSVYQSLWKSIGEADTRLDILRLFAMLTDAICPGETEKLWLRVQSEIRRHQLPTNIAELIQLAKYAYAKGDVKLGRKYLTQMPKAMALSYGGVSDILSLSIGQIPRLRTRLQELTEQVLLSGQSFADIRLISELRREIIGRSRRIRSHSSDSLHRLLQEDFGSSVLREFLPPIGRVAFIEWLDTKEYIASFVTVIHSDGSTSASWLELPEEGFGNVVKRIQARLTNWRPGRSGDPFEIDEWRKLEDWICGALEPYLDKDSHIVFFEHEEFAGVPWHVAVRRWSSSYATSWSSLLSIWEQPINREVQSVGIILVPRALESEIILNVFAESVEKTRLLAKLKGLNTLEPESPQACDRYEFSRVANNVNVLKILCHGYVDLDTLDVALMIAHNGALPPLLSVACNSEVGQKHRLSWRDCEKFSNPPGIVFSAACSSGVMHLIGVGDRLGLFTGFQEAGTRSLVAPRWNLYAPEVVPILDNTMEMYLKDNNLSLAKAVHTACKNAQQDLPLWLSWNLSIEGDWR